MISVVVKSVDAGFASGINESRCGRLGAEDSKDDGQRRVDKRQRAEAQEVAAKSRGDVGVGRRLLRSKRLHVTGASDDWTAMTDSDSSRAVEQRVGAQARDGRWRRRRERSRRRGGKESRL